MSNKPTIPRSATTGGDDSLRNYTAHGHKLRFSAGHSEGVV
jgi:hypothetical protein